MKDFNSICKLVEDLSPVEYATVATVKAAKIIPALREISGDGLDSVGMFAAFLVASVYADGKLDESEYLLILPMLKLCFGEDFDYESTKEIVKAFRPEGNELKKVVNRLVDMIGEFDDELKSDIITLSLLVCAIDGKISLKEKKYIKQLIR